MFIIYIVVAALGLLIGWVTKNTLFSEKGGLDTPKAIGLSIAVGVVTLLALAIFLEGKVNYPMEMMIDRAIADQQARDPTWIPAKRAPVRFKGSEPLYGQIALGLSVGFFFGIRRRKGQLPPPAVKNGKHFYSPHPTTRYEEKCYETAALEFKSGNIAAGLMA